MLTVTVFPERITNYSSQVFAGLYELRESGEIKLRFSGNSFPTLEPGSIHVPILPMQVTDESGVHVNFVIDLIDGDRAASVAHLEWADLYFKASLRPGSELDRRPNVRPFGLRYACTSSSESIFDRLLFASLASSRSLKTPYAGEQIRKILTNPFYIATMKFKATAKYSRLPPAISTFESPPSIKSVPLVFYRTRAYDPEQAGNTKVANEFHRVNQFRVQTIRSLKRHFGTNFVGGLRATPFTRARYPDLVVSELEGQRQHLAMVEKCLVCVTTRGLFDSTDWKVAEYMAAAKCVVAERLVSRLPQALKQNSELHPFTTADECVKICDRLLNNSTLAERSRRAAHDYYQKHVSPKSIMRNCLHSALS